MTLSTYTQCDHYPMPPSVMWLECSTTASHQDVPMFHVTGSNQFTWLSFNSGAVKKDLAAMNFGIHTSLKKTENREPVEALSAPIRSTSRSAKKMLPHIRATCSTCLELYLTRTPIVFEPEMEIKMVGFFYPVWCV
jgi:hypothetical protein